MELPQDALFCPACGQQVSPGGVRSHDADAQVVWVGGEQLPLASIGKRFGALLIDGAILVGALYVAFIIVFIVAAVVTAEPQPYDPNDPNAVDIDLPVRTVVIVMVATSLATVAAQWAFDSLGWSPGRAATGIRIARLDGRRPGIAHGLARYTMRTFSWLVLGLGYFWAFWDERNQTWHDKAAGTVVVRAAPLAERFPERRPEPLVTLPRIWLLVALGVVLLTASASFNAWWISQAEGDLFDSDFYDPYRESPRIERPVGDAFDHSLIEMRGLGG